MPYVLKKKANIGSSPINEDIKPYGKYDDSFALAFGRIKPSNYKRTNNFQLITSIFSCQKLVLMGR